MLNVYHSFAQGVCLENSFFATSSIYEDIQKNAEKSNFYIPPLKTPAYILGECAGSLVSKISQFL